MRPEKKSLTRDYLARLNASPFLLVVTYTGLKVGPLTELRRRLRRVGAELLVVKNSVFRLAAQEAGLGDWGGALTGQLAMVTGRKDLAQAAKVLKTFAAEFDRPKVQFGFLGNERLDAAQVLTLADLPPLEVLQAQFLGVVQAPATRLVRLLQTPATQLARVLNLHLDNFLPAGPAEDLPLATPAAESKPNPVNPVPQIQIQN